MRGAAAAITPSKGLVVRTWATCAARRRIFDGTQPTFTQVPPVVPRSTIVTCAPPCLSRRAAAKAAAPLPMIATFSAAPTWDRATVVRGGLHARSGR